MKLLAVLVVILMAIKISGAQNIPACDSLQVECCSFDLTQNTITLIASNYSSYLFDYPGFILYDSDLDTVAFETVNYFGISVSQPHTLNIIHPFELPFDGILELYVLFYDSLTCTFEVTIPDTITTNLTNNKLSYLELYPNPATNFLFAGLSEPLSSHQLKLRIIDAFGRERFEEIIPANGIQIPVQSIGHNGFYVALLIDPSGNIIETRKLLLK